MAVCETSDPSNNDGDNRIGTWHVDVVVFFAVRPYFLLESLPLLTVLLSLPLFSSLIRYQNTIVWMVVNLRSSW
jgi:hypothetical protein